uniref:Nucleolar protein 53 n=1 Tax=Rhipicephalus appendiculatus TaxID=34631 RepID=A0A131YEF9_RHIAP
MSVRRHAKIPGASWSRRRRRLSAVFVVITPEVAKPCQVEPARDDFSLLRDAAQAVHGALFETLGEALPLRFANLGRLTSVGVPYAARFHGCFYLGARLEVFEALQLAVAAQLLARCASGSRTLSRRGQLVHEEQLIVRLAGNRATDPLIEALFFQKVLDIVDVAMLFPRFLAVFTHAETLALRGRCHFDVKRNVG